MRKILFTMLSMLGLCMYAQQRTTEQAIDVAEKFWNKSVQRNKLRTVSHKMVNAAVQKVRSKKKVDGLKQSCYVVNDEENGRFVIVSADERMYTILGYSDNGVFDADSVAPGLLDMISVYDEQYTSVYPYLDQLQASQDKEGITAISPLITSKWGQSNPYNKECPVNKKSTSFDRCVTGCVATAMAQVMNYYKYPECGTGSNQYVSETQGIKQSMSFSSITIDWDNIMDEYGFFSTSLQETAVARLMHACGVSTNMDYGPSSGAYSVEMAYSLMNFWKYNPNIAIKERKYYSDSEWISTIYGELSAGRPILYSGSGSGCHQFILDGCDKNGLFHFNFGWSGYGDGYYAIDALIPESTYGSKLGNYSYEQDMVCYITPEIYGQREGEFTASESLGLGNSMKVGEYFKVNSFVYNRDASLAGRFFDGKSKFNGEIGVGLFDKDFNHVLSLYRRDASLEYYQGGALYKDIALNKTAFYDGAKYYIAFYAYSDDFGYTIARTEGGREDYYLATAEDGMVTFEAMKQMDGDTPELPVYTDIVVEENKAGELSERITNQEILTAKHWTISGELNGTDIALLRDAFQIGRITSLDLTNARIVKGGEPYYKSSYETYRTTDNYIGRYMFEDAWSLESLKLPSTTTGIGYYALNKCGISTLYIPDSCITIGYYGICNCDKLERIRIGKNLANMDAAWISNCPLLNTISVDDDNTEFKSVDGILYSKDGITLYKYPQGKSDSTFMIPDCIQVIGDDAFYKATLKHVLLPPGLKSIGSGAFHYCTELEEIDLPSTVQQIGTFAFYGCKQLGTINSTLENINLVEMNDNAFSKVPDNCTWHVINGLSTEYVVQPWWNSAWNIEDDLESSISSLNGYSNEDIHVSSESGTLILSTEHPTNVCVFDINGKQIKQIPLISGAHVRISLPKGIYIVGGKKVSVM